MKRLFNLLSGLNEIEIKNLDKSLCEFHDFCFNKAKGKCNNDINNCKVYESYKRYNDDLNYLGIGAKI
jgi:hypothetical protein